MKELRRGESIRRGKIYWYVNSKLVRRNLSKREWREKKKGKKEREKEKINRKRKVKQKKETR